MKYSIYVLLITLLVACSRKPGKKDLAEIKAGSWTWVSGDRSYFGDFIDFEKGGAELRADSIFEKSIFKGRITGYSAKHREIIIKIPGGERLVYYSHDFR